MSIPSARGQGYEKSVGRRQGSHHWRRIEPNWETDFYTRSEFDIFSANDANGDGVTWGYFNAGGIRMVIGPYNNESGNDDWALHAARPPQAGPCL